MKTLAELKRDAKAGTISLELLPVGHWSDGLPERLLGVRKCIGAKSNGIILQNANGRSSELTMERASLVEYTDGSLKVYIRGYREPTEAERKALEEWAVIESTEEYQRDLQNDMWTDGNQCFYRKKWFFSERHMEYLCGWSSERGMILDYNRKAKGDPKFIKDAKVKGDLELEYKVYHN